MAAISDKLITKSKFVIDYLQHLEVTQFKRKKRGEEWAKESQKTMLGNMSKTKTALSATTKQVPQA